MTPTLGSINLLEQHTELRKAFYSVDHWLIIKACNLRMKIESVSHSFLFYSLRPMDCSHPGSSVYRIVQARILQWVAISFSRVSSWPREWTQVSCIAGRFFTVWATKSQMEEMRREKYGEMSLSIHALSEPTTLPKSPPLTNPEDLETLCFGALIYASLHSHCWLNH